MKKIGMIGISLTMIAVLCSGCSMRSVVRSIGNSLNTTEGETGTFYDIGNVPSNTLNVDRDSKLEYINQLIDDKFYFEASDEEEREEYLYKGLLESLDDPYSVYYTAQEYEDLMTTSSGSYEGIGVSIQQNAETKQLTVIRVFQGSGAEEAGMLPNDMIIAVDGRELNGEDISEVVTWIKGDPGTTVNVTVYRPTTQEELELTIERRKIDNSTVSYSMKDNNIGYIEVTEFYEATAEQFSSAVEDLQSQGMKGLIVDLRNNPGGYVSTVVSMCNRILSDGVIVYTEDKDGNVLESYEADGAQSLNVPMVVLVNENSASASEIFAGCMKDHGTATIVGTKTFGKGIVQQVIPLSDGSAVKLTIAKYFTPNGNDIHKIGIEPDYEVELPEELKTTTIYPEDQDTQLRKAMELLTE